MVTVKAREKEKEDATKGKLKEQKKRQQIIEEQRRQIFVSITGIRKEQERRERLCSS